MVNALSDVEGNILDCKKAIEEFDNELLQLHWDVFDRIQGQFKDLDSELSNLRGLFEDAKVTDDNFNWSKEGIAQLMIRFHISLHLGKTTPAVLKITVYSSRFFSTS